MRSVGVHWFVMYLNPLENTAGCPNASVTNTTAGRNSAGPKWTWNESEWSVHMQINHLSEGKKIFIWVKVNSCVMINSKPFQDKIALSFISLTVNL